MSDDRIWRKLLRRLTASPDPHVRVGVLASKGGEETNADGMTVLQIAIIHEFGAPGAGIPQRSFIRSTTDAREREIAAMVAKLSKKIVEGKLTVEQALGLLGAWMVGEIQKTIRSGVSPELSPATVERKGSSTPLIDTGQLLSSIAFEVKKR